MGIIKAAASAASGMWEDQWKEVFWCDAMSSSELLIRGRKRTSPNSGNTGGDENSITEGSLIIVNEGQCAVVVDNGAVIAAYSEPGEHVFHAKRSPKGLLQEFGKRISYGGDAPYRNQMVYFINLHESFNHPFTVTLPVQFAAQGASLTENVSIRGVYSFRVTDPVEFYRRITGNVRDGYSFSNIGFQLDNLFRDAFVKAASDLCAGGIRIDQLSEHMPKLRKAVKAAIANNSLIKSGIGISDIRITSAGADMERTQRREDLDWISGKPAARGSNTNLQTGALSSSIARGDLKYTPPQQKSFRIYPAAHLPGIGAPERPPEPPAEPAAPAVPDPPAEPEPAAVQAPPPQPPPPPPVPAVQPTQVAAWQCSCGAGNTTRFCTECGKMQSWQCMCGHINQTPTCEHCGAPMQL